MKTGDLNKWNRKAAVAGQFYPGTRDELKSRLQELFQKSKINLPQEKVLRAIISPHAGYIFSGEVAASAFHQIPKNTEYKRVFILASSHQFYFRGAAVYCRGNYETPLGEIDVDKKLAKQLVKNSRVFIDKPEAHENEHSLEVQLPFLQYKLGKIKLVPILLGTNSANDCKKIAETLKPWFTPENLFVISTDFSHFPDYKNAIAVDKKTAEAICTNQPEKLLEVLEKNKTDGIANLATSLCGWTSVLTLLYLTEKNEFDFKKNTYQNSGDAKVYGDKNRVVGYWAMGVFEEESGMKRACKISCS